MPPDSPRMKFRLITPQDEPLVILTSCNANVMRYITGKPRTEEEAHAELLINLKLADGEHGLFVAEDKLTGEFIGLFIVRPFEQPGKTEIGYRLREKYWGKGFATEGARALLRYVFEQMERPIAVAVVEPQHIASRRVLEKSGFVHKTTGQFYNAELMYYEMTRSDFFNDPNLHG